ncbi:hypothetical protein EUZ09_03100 [Pediococcus pentosaceus]|nr:hypothetical protein [Pediococcus pentosaceus]
MTLIPCNNPTIKVEAKTVIKYTHPHEWEIAYYLKQDKNHYVKYRVTPIFKGNNLLAQGVQMEARSVGDNSIKFNVQDDVKFNYLNGTSKLKIKTLKFPQWKFKCFYLLLNINLASSTTLAFIVINKDA